MGRHRRSDAGRAATGSATGIMQADGIAEGHDPLHDAEYGPTMGIAPYLNPEAYADTYARSEAYLFETEAPAAGDGYAAIPRQRTAETAVFASDGFTPEGGTRRAGSHRRRKKAARPMRTGLLGVSAAVAIGTVAVATG
ncbi:CAP domain-containing protein, partial [Streptomyces violarus]|nr:CAP domain-containing protein [Streptomyces violarus]